MFKTPDPLFHRDPGFCFASRPVWIPVFRIHSFRPYHCRSAALYSGSLPTWRVSKNISFLTATMITVTIVITTVSTIFVSCVIAIFSCMKFTNKWKIIQASTDLSLSSMLSERFPAQYPAPWLYPQGSADIIPAEFLNRYPPGGSNHLH